MTAGHVTICRHHTASRFVPSAVLGTLIHGSFSTSIEGWSNRSGSSTETTVSLGHRNPRHSTCKEPRRCMFFATLRKGQLAEVTDIFLAIFGIPSVNCIATPHGINFVFGTRPYQNTFLPVVTLDEWWPWKQCQSFVSTLFLYCIAILSPKSRAPQHVSWASLLYVHMLLST